MDNELNALASGDPDLEKTTGLIRTNQHHEAANVEYTDRVTVSVQHVLIFDPVFADAVTGSRLSS